MNYYIVNNKIVKQEEEFNPSFYNYQKLTIEQSAFYEANPGVSINEIINMELNPVYQPTLEEVKLSKKNTFSQEAFTIRSVLVPDYKLINTALGVYSETDATKYKNYAQAFRNEYYRLVGLIDAATTIEEVNAIEHNYNSITL